MAAQLFEQEIYVWAKLKHRNILPLIGYAFDKDTGYPILASEWMDDGNVLEYVRTKDPSPGQLLRLVTRLLLVSNLD